MSHVSSFAKKVASATLACAVGCSPVVEPGPPPALTSLPRDLTAQEISIINAANGFSFELFRRVSAAEPQKNVFISPLSASLSLGMTLNGARGATFDGMRTALQFGSTTQADINTGYKSLIALLQGLDESTQFTIANSIWHTNAMTFSAAFIDAGKTWFDATVTGLPFANVDASKATINSWVDKSTNGKIPSIIDDIRPEDVMFLINAMYFKGSWRNRFDPAETSPADFISASGATQRPMMMHLDADLAVAQPADGAVAVDLPYGNAAYTMLVVLPPPGVSADAYAAGLTPASWNALTQSLHTSKAMVWMPRIKLTFERKMNDDLSALGMAQAFTDHADFSGMTQDHALSISYVKQKTFVDINEEGTEAAAVTVTGMQVTSAPMVVEVRLDRPYLFVIRERLSGAILFMGKINVIP